MDLSIKKYIQNAKPVLPLFELGDEIRRAGSLSYNPGPLPTNLSAYDHWKYKLTPLSSKVSGSILPQYKPATVLPETTMKKVNSGTSNMKQPGKISSSNGSGGTTETKQTGVDYAGAAVGVLGTVTDIANSAKSTVTAKELAATAPVRTENIGGILTEQYGPIDDSAAAVDVAGTAMSGLASGAASGAALGSVIPGLGTIAGGVIGGVLGGIGGLFAGSSKKRKQEEEAERAKTLLQNKNKYLRERSYSQSLLNMMAEEFGDLTSQTLFGRWATGKEPDINPMTGMSYKTYMVNTAHGKMPGKVNAMVAPGEVIESADGSMYKVGFGKFAKGKEPGNTDTEMAFIQNGDSIYSNAMINPDTGHTFAQDAPLYREMNMLPRLRMNLKITRNGLRGYKCGLERFARGAEAYTNLIPTVAGLLGAHQQYKEASQPLYAPDVNTENAYANSMIPKLMSLKQDYYPLWQQHMETEAAGRAATGASGGLSAGLKALAYANLYNNSQMNKAKSLFDTQLANNQLSQRAYEAALNVGAQDAARKQQGNIFNTEFLAKAHNAALQGRQMSLFNAINSLENYYANEFKRKLFDRTMSNYEALTANDRAKTQMLAKAMGGNSETAPTAPTMTLKSYIDNLDQGTPKHMQTDWMNPIVQQRFADKYAPAPDYLSMIKKALQPKRRTVKKSKKK